MSTVRTYQPRSVRDPKCMVSRKRMATANGRKVGSPSRQGQSKARLIFDTPRPQHTYVLTRG